MKDMLVWKIVMADGTTRLGAEPFAPGRIRIRETLPEQKIRSLTAKIHIPLGDDGRIFMNGYQTWTHCREYTKKDRIRGLGHLPQAAVARFGLDRYADYHFFRYPERPGYTHGYSYCYFREGESFRLIGSLDETNGYTMFLYNAEKEVLTIKRDCEDLLAKEKPAENGGTADARENADGRFTLFDLWLGEGGEEQVFDGWFGAMGISPRTEKKIAGYSSWYNRYQEISEECIAEDLKGAAEVLRPGDLFQIDDGWEPFVGDWLTADAKKFPNEMKAPADAIHEKGFLAGLWLAPFVAEEKSALFREHRDWFLADENGPWKAGGNWSGFYALDIDKPEVTAYLEEVFRQVFDVWEYDLVKLDFLYAAAPFGSEGETRAARMTRAMKLLRKWCGDRLILACGVPLYPAFGLADYCRVSCDVSLSFDDKLYMRLCHRERPSTKHAVETDTARRQLNGRAFGSDPDVFFLRTENISLTNKQKDLLARTCAECGSVFLTSDNMSRYTDEQKAAYRAYRELFDKK